ncbi:potassium channel family protein [Massilia glaciei]|uniref:TrkA family potassium uptake protein n=1 Tax=Massilia glaciei TaxID=1524097 RepID=A0A2U2HLJ6_9BURK|nr:TrkA family potassium uptake protein [Massilia glaciei]PWF48296.1 TrkA family potassium uptake protein [Massilia glaciei]
MGRIFTEQFAFSAGDSVLVIGLGRFGSSVAQSLVRLGHDVMGVDTNGERVQLWADKLTHAVQADSTKEAVMLQLGAADFSHAIVAIGGDIASSLLTLMVLTELGIKDIWVKALDRDHGQLAKKMGAHHVVTPEADMGERVAHLITGRLIDFIEFDDGFAIAKIHAPVMTHDKTLTESRVREQFGVTIVGVKRANTDFQHATPETSVQSADLLIVSGPTRKIELFASGTKVKK